MGTLGRTWSSQDRDWVVHEHIRLINDPDKSQCDLHVVCKDGDFFYTKLLFYFFEPSLKTLLSESEQGGNDSRMVLIDHSLSVKDIQSVYEDSKINDYSAEEALLPEASKFQLSEDEVSDLPLVSNGLPSTLINLGSSREKDNSYSEQDTNVCTFSCEYCGVTKYKTMKQLQAHIWSKHKSKPDIRYKCSECFKEFDHKYELKKHSTVHTPPAFECSNCGKTFKRKNELFVHYKTFHEEETDIYKCSKCSMTFNIKSNLTRHMSKHESGKFKCILCSATFNRLDSFKRHQKLHK